MKKFKIIDVIESPYDFKNDNGQQVKGIGIKFLCLVETTKADGTVTKSTCDVKVNYNAYNEFMQANGLHKGTDLIGKNMSLYAYASEDVTATSLELIK